MKKKIFWVLLIIIVGIQFIRPAINQSTAISANDISRHYNVPDPVKNILRNACNDCHSNNTAYPWYSNIQPVGWWLASHVNDGKKELNFSEFASYEPKRQHHKMEEVIEQVKEKNMPLDSYTWQHEKAKLTEDERRSFLLWASMLVEEIAAKYNIQKEK